MEKLKDIGAPGKKKPKNPDMVKGGKVLVDR